MMSGCVGRKVTGILRGSGLSLVFSSPGNPGVAARGITAQFQLSFAREISRVYNVLSEDMYYVEAPPQGELSMTRLVGTRGLPSFACNSGSFCCAPFDITIGAQRATCWEANTEQASNFGCLVFGDSLTARQAMPKGIAISVSGEQLTIISQVSFIFADLTGA